MVSQSPLVAFIFLGALICVISIYLCHRFGRTQRSGVVRIIRRGPGPWPQACIQHVNDVPFL